MYKKLFSGASDYVASKNMNEKKDKYNKFHKFIFPMVYYTIQNQITNIYIIKLCLTIETFQILLYPFQERVYI